MPPSLISLNLIICEKILREADGVLSIIRIADIFYHPPRPDIPIEQQSIVISVLAIGKFNLEDTSEHSLQLRLARPDGTTDDVGESIRLALSEIETKIPDAPRGFNVIAQFGVIPKHMGTHYMTLVIDGEEVARTPFTLSEKIPETKG